MIWVGITTTAEPRGIAGLRPTRWLRPLRLQFCPHLPFRVGHRLGDTRPTEETVLRAMGCGLLTPERAEALVPMGRGLLFCDRKCVDVPGCYNRRNHRHGHIMNTRWWSRSYRRRNTS